MAKRRRKCNRKLEVCHPDAVGIDIGSREHWVAVPDGCDEQPVRSFGTVTSQLHEIAAWLSKCGVTTVAMESTGVYWVPLYEVLEDEGFEVLLVNARHVKNVPGRKSDVLDCQWIQKLHSYGLLRGSFRPPPPFVELRAYLRQRHTLVETAAREVQHMQKALLLMNVQLHHAVADITGKTGMLIVRAVVSGECRPEELAKHRDPRCRATGEQIAEALRGTYQREHIFVLQQALNLYDAMQQQLAACDQRIEQTLDALATDCPAPKSDLPPAKRRGSPKSNQPTFEIRSPLHRITAGVDLTQLPAIAPHTALSLLSEVGTDMTRWPTEKHFTSWLNLAPGTTITGGKVITARRRSAKNRAGLILRQAAVSIGRSATALGAFYRRIALRRAKGKAVVAVARKLACLIYRMLRYGMDFHERGAAQDEHRYEQRKLSALRKQAKSLGYELQQLQPET